MRPRSVFVKLRHIAYQGFEERGAAFPAGDTNPHPLDASQHEEPPTGGSMMCKRPPVIGPPHEPTPRRGVCREGSSPTTCPDS